MTYEEIKAEVARWPVAEQLRLLEDVSRAMRETLEPHAAARNGARDTDAAWREEFEAERARLLKDIPPESSAHRLLGILRTSEYAPTDEEIREDYTNYLIRKYS
ncbi:MAG: hypothetical protein M3Y58_14680 [Chloroflexota bacterium]|nr:hypothetical protein [Chloroflexota bacterium]